MPSGVPTPVLSLVRRVNIERTVGGFVARPSPFPFHGRDEESTGPEGMLPPPEPV